MPASRVAAAPAGSVQRGSNDNTSGAPVNELKLVCGQMSLIDCEKEVGV